MSQRRAKAPPRRFNAAEAMRHFVGDDAGELAGEGDERCDKPRPPGCPDDVACPFRKGHACPCRYFGKLEHGGGFS